MNNFVQVPFELNTISLKDYSLGKPYQNVNLFFFSQNRMYRKFRSQTDPSFGMYRNQVARKIAYRCTPHERFGNRSQDKFWGRDRKNALLYRCRKGNCDTRWHSRLWSPTEVSSRNRSLVDQPSTVSSLRCINATRNVCFH